MLPRSLRVLNVPLSRVRFLCYVLFVFYLVLSFVFYLVLSVRLAVLICFIICFFVEFRERSRVCLTWERSNLFNNLFASPTRARFGPLDGGSSSGGNRAHTNNLLTLHN
jgi:hypothetical protein